MTSLANGRYVLNAVIGRGGMGRVWDAEDTTLRRRVAIKEVVAPEGLDNEARNDLYARASHEARNAARVEHPSLVTIYDVVMEEGHPWMVMEFLETPNLQEYIEQNGPLAHSEVASLAAGLLDVVAAIHNAGIVHRDIKPSNVAWSADGKLRLLDFGIAKHTLDTALTDSGMVIGTPSYMAPECVMKDEVGPESDLWSVGAVLYYALTGKPLFERTTSQSIMYAIAYENIPKLATRGPLQDIVSGLLQKKATRRLTIPRALTLLEKAVKFAQAETTTRPRQKRRPSPAARRVLIASSAVCGIGALVFVVAASGILAPDGNHTTNGASSSPTVSSTTSSPSSHTSPRESSPSPSPSRSYWLTDGSSGQVYHDAEFTIPMSQGWKVKPGDDESEVNINTDDGKTYTIRSLGIGDLQSTAKAQHDKSWGITTSRSSITYVGSNYAVWDYSTPVLCRPFPCPSGSVNRYSTSIERKPVGKLIQITVSGPPNIPSDAYDKDQREDLDIFGRRVDFTPDSPFAKD